MKKVYYIDIDRTKQNNAGAKAPDDFAAVCKEKGYEVFLFPNFPKEKNWLYQKLWLLFVGTRNWNKVMRTVQEGDVVLFQHPIYGHRISEKMIPKIQAKKGCKFIALIHDLESLRGGIQGVIKDNTKTNQIADNVLLKHFDVIICHNESMKKYLISQGFDADKLVSLEIFDYLSEYRCEKAGKSENPSIAIAGTLAKGKCGYIYEIYSKEAKRNEALTINLFGNNFDESIANDHMVWHGSFKPEELPKYLKGDFGLVWDGTSIAACEGNTGEYLKYNNPHKVSLYLSAGLPVIIWKQAALSDFVLKHNVGIAVDNLENLDEIISGISEEEYAVMRKNAEAVSDQLHSGYYYKKAVDEAIGKLS